MTLVTSGERLSVLDTSSGFIPGEGRMPTTPAKVRLPDASGALARPRLFARLDRVRREGGAVWVTGEPGCGKTTLVASWVAKRRAPCLWYHLDAADAELATFFYYLVLAERGASRRSRPLPALTPEYYGDLETFVRSFFRELFARLGPGTVVVLDDVPEVAPDDAFMLVLRQAVEELPRGVTLVLSSRSEVPPGLARQRANRTLHVVAGRELLLTLPEAKALARRWKRAARGEVEEMLRAVHGWAAGLVLLLERAREGGEPAPLRHQVAAATFDYFAADILDRADPLTRTILLEVSLLPTVTRQLAAAATGVAEAGRVLTALARRGLFVASHGGCDGFELHPLFHEFLRRRADEELTAERRAAVRRAAAAHLAAQGDAGAEEAIALLAGAGAYAEMSALVARQAPAAALAGRLETIERWIRLFPDDVRERDPWLLHWSGVALLPRAPAAALERLARAQATFEEAGDPAGAWLAWAAVVEAILFEWKNLTPLSRSLRDHERLAARFGFPSPEIQARVTLTAAAAAIFHWPDHPALPGWSSGLRAMAMAPGAPVPVRIAAGAFLLLHEGWLLGELSRGRELVQALGALARAPGVPPRSTLQWLSCEAPYHFFAGDLVACAATAAEAIAGAEATGIHARDFIARVQELSVALVRQPEEIPARLAAMQGALRGDSAVDLSTMRFAQATLALRRGQVRECVTLAEEALARAKEAGYAGAEVLALVLLARARAQAGDDAAARRDLSELRARADRMASAWIRFLAALVEAEHLLDGASPELAAGPLSLAFRLAREKGVHPFLLFSRADVARFAATALGHAIEPEYTRALIASERLSPPEGAATDAWPWRLRVRVLGAFEVECAGRALAHPDRHRRPLALLSALIALGGREVPEGALAEALWPDAQADAAHHALETALYRLRRIVGPEAIVQRQRQLSLARDACWVDALELEERLGTALGVLDARAPRSEAVLREAGDRIAALYRGPMLAGEEAPWAVQARERLHRRVGRCLAGLSARAGARGASSPALRIA
jgi:ATP/maltotriose-dependent transcriptional regulator MalT